MAEEVDNLSLDTQNGVKFSFGKSNPTFPLLVILAMTLFAGWLFKIVWIFVLPLGLILVTFIYTFFSDPKKLWSETGQIKFKEVENAMLGDKSHIVEGEIVEGYQPESVKLSTTKSNTPKKTNGQ